MGLDQFAFGTDFVPGSPVDFCVPENCSAKQVHYWRKHPDLHGWMQRLWEAKGGKGVFNCKAVVLTSDDLDALEADVRACALPKTSGFFFGESDGSEVDDDLAFISKARRLIAAGKTVFYHSWW